jgi:hypothetical protein
MKSITPETLIRGVDILLRTTSCIICVPKEAPVNLILFLSKGKEK